MPSHTQQQISPYSAQQLFDLVADVEHYPDFLPWCRAARIISRAEGEFMAELVISFKHMTERYTSRVTLIAPTGPEQVSQVAATMVSGPFDFLINRWDFRAAPGGGTQIDFFLDFKFRSRLLEKLIGPLFGHATARMVDAFKQRADALYGKEK